MLIAGIVSFTLFGSIGVGGSCLESSSALVRIVVNDLAFVTLPFIAIVTGCSLSPALISTIVNVLLFSFRYALAFTSPYAGSASMRIDPAGMNREKWRTTWVF